MRERPWENFQLGWDCHRVAAAGRQKQPVAPPEQNISLDVLIILISRGGNILTIIFALARLNIYAQSVWRLL